MGGNTEGTGKSRIRGNHNQDLLCEKRLNFKSKEKEHL